MKLNCSNLCLTEVEKELEKSEKKKAPGLPSKKGRTQSFESQEHLGDGRSSAGRYLLTSLVTKDIYLRQVYWSNSTTPEPLCKASFYPCCVEEFISMILINQIHTTAFRHADKFKHLKSI